MNPSERRALTGEPAQPHPVDWARREGAVDEVLGELAACAARARRRNRWAAASAVAVVAMAAFVFRSSLWPTPTTVSPRGILVSQPARQVLPDGSLVELKPGAEIAIAFTKTGPGPRKVLLQKGEAHFAVAKDAQRPFVVVAGRIEVRAIGTAFAVGRDPTQVEVIVTEGTVAIDRMASLPQTSSVGIAPSELTLATVEAGNRVVVATDRAVVELVVPAVQTITKPELTERLAWRIPQLEFSGTRLTDAVAMFNQHNDVKFVLADHALDGLQVSGYLRADKTETFILLLETNFGLKAERLGREIVVRRP